MKIYLAKDTSINLDLTRLGRYLSSKCSYVEFIVLPDTFEATGEYLNQPLTHKKYLKQSGVKPSGKDFILLASALQYDNNFFYEEKDGLILLSFFGWKYLTSLPYENGFVYFICSILIDEIVPYDEIDHTKRLGCVNDFLYDKTRVDDGMRQGHLCLGCKEYISKHPLSKEQSIIYQDILSLLKDLSFVSGNEQSVIRTKLKQGFDAFNFSYEIDTIHRAANNNHSKSIFISYAHEDEKSKIQLENHLEALKRSGLIKTWSDREIAPGAGWKGVIDKNLREAQMILLLISASFLSSDYSNDVELPIAIEMHKKGVATVIPIILKSCAWDLIPQLANLQVLPQDGKPIHNFTRKDDAYTSIARAIAKIIQG